MKHTALSWTSPAFFGAVMCVSAVAQTFSTSTPTGQHFVVGTGQTLSFPVAASAAAGQSIQLTVAGLPPGARTTPVLPVTGSPAAVSFTWTPAQAGAFVIVFVATNQTTRSQSLCSISVNALTGCQGSAATYGSGCATSTASVPKLTPFGCPGPGLSASLEVSQAAPGALAVLLFSMAPGATALPVPLFPSACSLLLQSSLVVATSQPVTAYGGSILNLAFPPGLPGYTVYAQALVAGSSLALTRAVAVEVR